MSELVNDLCDKCSGRGFNWKKGQIVSRINGEVIADTLVRGDGCIFCLGTGKVPTLSLTWQGWLSAAGCSALLLAFIILLLRL